jgi:hypothetical protein
LLVALVADFGGALLGEWRARFGDDHDALVAEALAECERRGWPLTGRYVAPMPMRWRDALLINAAAIVSELKRQPPTPPPTPPQSRPQRTRRPSR